MKRGCYMVERSLSKFMAVLGLAVLPAVPALAQSLPGGAESLRESFSDWQVMCVSKDDASRCAMSQA